MKKILVIIGLLGVIGYQMNQVIKLENKIIELEKYIRILECEVMYYEYGAETYEVDPCKEVTLED